MYIYSIYIYIFICIGDSVENADEVIKKDKKIKKKGVQWGGGEEKGAGPVPPEGIVYERVSVYKYKFISLYVSTFIHRGFHFTFKCKLR
jgi:hypothetical protein